ncbi:MAG: hypothetical protein A2491_03890 [Bacteroidetes bacterium RIFOXYC12_FULL_35_7]|nr:MAG: hypothetical protein A2491_03890 [Bacteroidetes bacterium RIFOXYC12_FULL_35_7]
MTTVDRKLRFVQEFLRIADDEIIDKLEKLLGSERKKKIPKEPDPLTMDELNKRIDQSEDDFKKGRFSETKDLLKSIETWK